MNILIPFLFAFSRISPHIVVLGNGPDDEKVSQDYTTWDMRDAIEKGDVHLVTKIATHCPKDESDLVTCSLDIFWNTSLHKAVMCGNLEMVDLLMKHGARPSITVPNYNGCTPVALATANEPILRKLVEEYGADIRQRHPAYGYTLLHSNRFAPSVAAAEFLISKGLPVTNVDNDGYTPLIAASRFNAPELIRVLVKHGANVNEEVDSKGCTALHWSAFSSLWENVKVLFEVGADLAVTTTTENIRALRILVEEYGVDYRQPDPTYGCTLLHSKRFAPSAAAAEFLISKGLSVTDVNYYGDTPLITASRFDAPELIRVLVKHGAKVNDVDSRGYTALHWSAISRLVENVKLLLELGADLEKMNEIGKSALELSTHPMVDSRISIIENLYQMVSQEKTDLLKHILDGNEDDELEVGRAIECVNYGAEMSSDLAKKTLERFYPWILNVAEIAFNTFDDYIFEIMDELMKVREDTLRDTAIAYDDKSAFVLYRLLKGLKNIGYFNDKSSVLEQRQTEIYDHVKRFADGNERIVLPPHWELLRWIYNLALASVNKSADMKCVKAVAIDLIILRTHSKA